MSAAPKGVSTGEELDGFAIGELLHSSPLARLFRVEATAARGGIEFPILMKIPKTRAGEGGEGLLGFETEVRILGALSGRHVPRFVSAGEIDASPYLAMEEIEGRTLGAVAGGSAILPGEVARLGAAIADALHDLHGQGTIHLDLKPENVIVRPSGEVALVDFGMAHHVRFPDLLSEEQRFAAGSAPYISPDQVMGNRADPRSDIFSLGAILYELATGKLPYGTPRTLAGLADRRWLVPPPPRALQSGIPPWLQEVILRCLETSAEERYQSAAHVAFDLRHPDQVKLTERAQKLERAGAFAHVRRWWAARRSHLAPPSAPGRPMSVPVVMIAVDTMHQHDARHPALLHATANLLSLSREFRLICVSVVHGEPVGGAEDRPSIQFEHLVRLRHWVAPLRVPESQLSLHVIEAHK